MTAARNAELPTTPTLRLVQTADTQTRKITDWVDEAGHLKNQAQILVSDSNQIHRDTEELHAGTLKNDHQKLSDQLARRSVPEMLEELNDLGLSWREIARISGVSVPALRKWRSGESSAKKSRKRVAKVLGICQIASDRYHISDVASWLEIPICESAPVNGLDLLAGDRFDLALQLACDNGSDAERILDEFEPDWRERYTSAFEVFTAPDGLPALRFTK